MAHFEKSALFLSLFYIIVTCTIKMLLLNNHVGGFRDFLRGHHVLLRALLHDVYVLLHDVPDTN